MTEVPIESRCLDELRWMIQESRAPRLRTMREFAETEIVLPNGPFSGRRFRCDRQPYAGLFFACVDSGNWTRHFSLGPTQSGKTLTCFVIPLLYHLFERRETVVCGLPDQDMAADKWNEDILPVLERTRYKDLLPRRGGGSKGGKVRSIRFRHGVTLRFMSAGGGDKTRSAFTSRVLVMTEVDGFDTAGGTSRESDKITQLEARTRAYRKAGPAIYGECTVSIEEGRTWQEYTHGTTSRIVLPCPHCREWVALERENLFGYEDAADETAARDASHFYCSACGEQWTEAQREAVNQECRLVHRGQTIDRDGNVHGDPPRTQTLGFRWSAVNNLFTSSGEIGVDEWKASRKEDEDNAEKELCQFVWAVPYVPPKLNLTTLQADPLTRRQGRWGRGELPDDTLYFTVSVDPGMYVAHWTAIAWRDHGSGQIVDYGRFEVPSTALGVDRGLLVALREFRDEVLGNGDHEGWPRRPDQVWIDAGYQPATVYAFCCESREPGGDRFRPLIGRGEGNEHAATYQQPKTTGNVVIYIGEQFHVVRLKQPRRVDLVEINVDHWKSVLHGRLTMPLTDEAVGAITLPAGPPRDHIQFAKHLTAEKRVEEYIAGRGTVTRWERIRKANHWLDTTTYATVAGWHCGCRVAEPTTPATQSSLPSRPTLTTPDGRPFLITERES